ncbi:S-methyl-5-thioribose-1-phosphate isomerase [Oceanithermus sp.]|uniref:S-methyl-5-thioribose-1-phosphate isomerase n=1 Tax=Oceanithermus sp. TaxID=2268145 RepID=UPI0025DF5C2D|nr:S-methyl-5-thioribose-1-phosphate isomerase [Oceanithermus sp.]
MNVGGQHYRTIWLKPDDDRVVQIIDQRPLPHKFVIEDLASTDAMARAIKEMHLRGAGLIGAAAGWGMYLAALEAPQSSMEAFLGYLHEAGEKLKKTRPTAVNLEWAVDRQLREIASRAQTPAEGVQVARDTAQAIADEDAEFCRRIGEHGVKIIEEIYEKKGDTVHILTHCNAGWLAFVDYGTATAPMYEAQKRGIPIHVWVDETRPRNQGARLTAWELVQQGVPHTVVADNVGGHLMQHGLVDMVITGADRVTRCGDVANKIGTYLKALAAADNGVPFYVALPSSTLDWSICDGVAEIPIEQRGEEEVKYIQGLHEGEVKRVLLTPPESPAANYGFDVTPARLVRGLITERGIAAASEEGLLELYPERR